MIRKLLVHSIAVVLTVWLLSGSLVASDTDYQEAVKALGAKDYTSALRYLESAIKSDPENLRYANEYRQAAIHNKDFDRSLHFFEQMASEHPDSANVHLNFGFAYVDKIPIAGSITQVILANNALNEFNRAVELQATWIALYTRGMSYLFWPKVFNRAQYGVADLKSALKFQKAGPRRSYYVKTYVGLGDGYWKTDDIEKARRTWQEGLRLFPDNPDLKVRLAKTGDELKATIEANFDPSKRVDTDLKELWADSKD